MFGVLTLILSHMWQCYNSVEMIKVAITSIKNNNEKIINEKLKQILEISQRAVSHGTSVSA